MGVRRTNRSSLSDLGQGSVERIHDGLIRQVFEPDSSVEPDRVVRCRRIVDPAASPSHRFVNDTTGGSDLCPGDEADPTDGSIGHRRGDSSCRSRRARSGIHRGRHGPARRSPLRRHASMPTRRESAPRTHAGVSPSPRASLNPCRWAWGRQRLRRPGGPRSSPLPCPCRPR